MTTLLFTYGTLRPDATANIGREERARLARESEPVGPASMPGRLVDLGGYPGLLPHWAGRVAGHVVRLRVPQVAFRWLDAYEGLASRRDGAPDGDYVRSIHRVTTPSGRRLTSWVYVLEAAPPGAVPIHGPAWPLPLAA